MNLNKFLCILFMLQVTLAKADDDVSVIKTEKEFSDLILKENVLVKFFAPWCGHCKALAPEYLKAAKQLKTDKILEARLIKVDCTDDKTKKVCSKYSVSGYPTLKYFSPNAKKPFDYSGGRDSEGLVSFVKKMLQDSVVAITSQKQLDKLVEDNKMVIVEYAESPSKRFRQVAEKLRLSYSFAKISDEALLKAHEMKKDGIALFRSFDEPKLVFSDKLRKLNEWISRHSFPILGEMDGANYKKYFEKNKPIFWIAVEKKNATQMDAVRALTSAFKPLREEMLAIFIDGPSFKDALDSMGFTKNYPNAMLVNKEEKYRFEDELNEKNIAAFAQRYADGKLERYFRSESAPKENKGPIIEVVGETYGELVLDEGHDVLLEYYLTYCQHCKKFEPEYAKIAELFKDEKLLRVARLNGEKNDTPQKIEGYPTVMLFRAGLKDQPLKYEGDRTAEAVEKWVLNNAPLLRKGEDKKKEPKKEEKKEL